MSGLDQGEPPKPRKRIFRSIVNGASITKQPQKRPMKEGGRENGKVKLSFNNVEEKGGELNFGVVETPASSPHLDALKMEYSWRRYTRQTQITILSMLLLIVIIVLVAEMIDSHILAQGSGQTSKTYVKDVLGYVIPIFTFMLGMGSRSHNDK